MHTIYGYDFYGEESQRQTELIAEINGLFDPPIDEIDDGMCFLLAIQFISDYIRASTREGAAPNEIFDRITGDTAYLRQVAGNMRAYITNQFNLKRDLAHAEAYLGIVSKKGVEIEKKFETDARDVRAVLPPEEGPRAHLIIIRFPEGAHALAAATLNGTTYVYDPNFGVHATQDTADFYKHFFTSVYSPETKIAAYEVKKRKAD